MSTCPEELLPISPKTIEILKDIKTTKSRLFLMSGAYRSLKTTAASFAVLQMIERNPNGRFMILGKCLESIERNVINSLRECLGEEHVKYSGNKSTNAIICGKNFGCVGCPDTTSEERIKGATLHGILVDEAITIPKASFLTALSRLSPPGAIMIATTNPAQPTHWLYEEFINNPMISTTNYQLKMDDNPYLTEEYVSFMKATHRGVMYDRYILGKWVKAEGLVFSDFSKEHIYDEDVDFDKAEFGAFVDYGAACPTCFLQVSLDNSRKPRLFVHDEFYYDCRKENNTKTEIEFTRDFIKFCEPINRDSRLRWVQCDPHNNSFITSVRRNSSLNMLRANNKVLPGIMNLGTLFYSGEIGIHARCKNLIRELQNYSWDADAAEHGEDKPMKVEDHAVDTLRYACMAMNRPMSEKVEQTSKWLREHHDMGMRSIGDLPAHKWNKEDSLLHFP